MILSKREIASMLFGAALLAVPHTAPEPASPGFVGVPWWQTTVKVKDVTGKTWDVRLREGCRFIIVPARIPGEMPRLAPSADPQWPEGPIRTDEQCRKEYAAPEKPEGSVAE